MKVRLLDPVDDRGVDPRLPAKVTYLIEDDLELRRLYKAMAADDSYLVQVAEKVIPLGITDPEAIRYRQNVLADCLAHRAVIEKMYAIAVDGDEVRRKVFLAGLVFRDPVTILNGSLRLLEPLVTNLKQLRALSDAHAREFNSAGFRQFFTMISQQLNDDYLRQLDDHLAELNLPRGTLLSAQLTLGNKGRRYLLHVPPRRNLWDRLTGNHSGYGFEINERDVAGSQALAELAGRAINDIANTLTQSADHVRGFFVRLRFELGFYRGCLNLHDRLTKAGVPTCFPEPTPLGTRSFRCRDLRDVGLCLSTERTVRGNDIDGQNACLVMVTGANEGGKSTFLRSIGTAQVMMQAGMFVTASSLRAEVTSGVFTHFKREEDDTMTHGKFDEELDRMNTLAAHITAQSMLLCNESFASTNEREGSQIARGIIDAMLKCEVAVVFVTHMYDLAHSLYLRRQPTYLFLRAERRPDGTRTFGMQAAPPEPTSYGEDSFRRVFGAEAHGPVQRLRSG
jgi:MutS domain V